MNPLKLFLVAILFVSSASFAAEQPVYKVVQKADSYEVRAYEPFVVVEVVLSGPEDETIERGFSLLAGYVYGQNAADKKFDLTAPVMQTPLLGVSQGSDPAILSEDRSEWLVQLMLPKAYPLSELPEPLDPRVKLKQLQSRKFAVIRYSGSWLKSNYDEHLDILKQAISQAGLVAQGQPVFARYDPVYTLWHFRTNEMWVKVQ